VSEVCDLSEASDFGEGNERTHFNRPRKNDMIHGFPSFSCLPSLPNPPPRPPRLQPFRSHHQFDRPISRYQEGDSAWSVAVTYNQTQILSYFEEFSLNIEKGNDHQALGQLGRSKRLIFNPVRHPFQISSTWMAQWSSSSFFLFKKNNVIFREATISLYSCDTSLTTATPNLIGRSLITLDSTARNHTYILTLLHPDGAVGEVEIHIRFKEVSDDKAALAETGYRSIDPFEEVKRIKRESGCKGGIGKARALLGARPKYPVLIIPGLASSALEAIVTDEREWKRERVWIDPFKIGKLAVLEKVAKVFASNPKETNANMGVPSASTGNLDEIELEGDRDTAEKRRRWIEHMTLGNDGVSDPPNIKVRAVQGLHAIDYLATVSVARAPSYVFAHMIQMLFDVGYDDGWLDACPYDWRLPPHKLQERDYFFGRMKKKIEAMVEHKNAKLVLLAHSMGNRVVQYFLEWLKRRGEEKWIEQYIHAHLAMGAPFLGSPKAIRTVLFGDAMGLEMFLTKEESLYMARVSASLPWLFPIMPIHYPDEILRVSQDSSSAPYGSFPLEVCLQTHAARAQRYYEEYYSNNSHYLLAPDGVTPPILSAPPLKRIWLINGINRQTEVGYFMKSKRAELDNTADRYSGKKMAGINPRGLMIQDGIAYETPDTYQQSIKGHKSGDGTVPYCSLNFASTEWGNELLVYPIEVEDAEHREMLNNEAVFNEVINLVCEW
jgi:hypothetical protein